MTFQKLDDKDIQILIELFTHPLNLPQQPLEKSNRYGRCVLWILGLFELFFLIDALRSSSTILLFITLPVILLTIIGLGSLYFILYLHRNYSLLIKKRYQNNCPTIVDSYLLDRHRKLKLTEIRRIISYHGLYFIVFFKKIVVAKPDNISHENFQSFFSEYSNIVYEEYNTPFSIKKVLLS